MVRTACRRVLPVLGLILALFLTTLAAPVAAQTVRKSITALTATELMSLRRGVAAMKARNSAPRGSVDFRRSWVFWANIHGHFGDTCAGPIQGNGMSGVRLWSATSAAETSTWCTCEHRTNQFLTWHRMYMYYFEQVLRQASGDPTLTLPFWDYATDPKLPVALRATTYVNESGQTVPNPLRAAARRPNLNNGSAGLSANTVSSANAMAATTLTDFSSRLETAPHGAVHCSIPSGSCPNGLMGAVASAALDPIFYLHHANMDRLYQCWLAVDQAGRLPSDPAVLDRTYSFVDATGTVQTRMVRDMLTTSALGYSYTAGGGCPAAGTPPRVTAEVSGAAPEARMAQGAPSGGIPIGPGTTVAPVEMQSTGGAERAAAAAGPVRSAVVTVEGVTANVAPGVLFNVYLANDKGQRQPIGIIDFFAFGGPARGGGGHGGHRAPTRSYEFDATAAVRALGLGPSRQPSLVFEPTTGLSDSTPDAAGKDIAPNASVRFERARLRVER